MTAAESLVGREDEFDRVAQLLDARDELPAAIVFHGEAGIGKTSLWLAAVERAGAIGYRVLSSRPAETETSLSYAGLADLLEGVIDEVLPSLPPIPRRALERALLLTETEAEADQRAVAAAFLAIVRNLAGDQPLCLAIDDVQWLDAASRDAIGFALARLHDDPVASLLSLRGDVPSWLRRARIGGGPQAIELRGLSIGAMHELLRARLGTRVARPTLVRLWETSAGNPFFALELALALERRGFAFAPGDALPIPSSLDELLRERLDTLGPRAIEAANVAAALSEPTVGLVGSALGDGADAGLLDAVDAQILELEGNRIRFTHPLLGSAVAARQTQRSRRALHARLADLVPTDEERARHLALATVRPDREVAAFVEAAARAANARGAPHSAAELADQAVRLTPGEAAEDKRRLRLFAADRYYAAANVDRATVLLEQARNDSVPGEERAVVLIQLARMAATARDACDLLQAALAESADAALHAEAHLGLAGLMRFVEGVERGLEHAELAVDAATKTGDPAIRCRALAAYGLLRFNAGEGIAKAEMEEALALERSLPDWPLEDGGAFISCHQLWWSGAVEQARELLHELERALNARGDVPGQASALWYLALTEWRAGDWAEADRCATGSLELNAQLGPVSANEEFPSAIVDAHLGRVDRARNRARAAIERATEEGMLIGESGFSWVLGSLELSLGNPVAALPHLKRAHELRNSTLVLEPGMRLEVGDLVEALVAAEELDAADQALLAVEGRAVALDRAWALAVIARGRGLVLAARGALDGAFASFERALGEHARVTDPFQHARTLLALGRTQRRAKKRGAARTTLEDALTRFETLGAPLWADQTRAELARIGGRAPSRGELTEAERRIALLVVDGRRNREVAAELYLTEHSVETALSRIYRKLGIRSRSELGRALSKT